MLNNVKQTKFTNLEVLVRHLSFTHVIWPGKRHSPVDHGASEHLGQCSSPQGLGNGPVGESNFTGVLWQKWMSFPFNLGPNLAWQPRHVQIKLGIPTSVVTAPTLTMKPWRGKASERHAGFVGGTSGRWIKNVHGHTQHTPHLTKHPQGSDQLEKKNNHSKSNWPLWLVSPQNLAYRILLFSTWPPHNNSKTRPADRSNPMAYNQAWKHGSLLIGRWIWELRLQLWKHRPLRGKQHTSSKRLRTSNQFWDSRAFVHQVNHQLLKYPCCLIQRHLREKQASWQHSSMHLAWVSVGSAWVQSAKAILQTYHDDVGCSNLGHLNWQEEQKTVNGFHCLCDPLTGRGSSTWAASFIMEKISISAEEF